MSKTLLFSGSSLRDSTNTLILNSTIDYVIATKRFDGLIVMLLNSETKKHYLEFEKNLVVLIYFLKFSLYLYSTPFKFFQVK